MATLQPVPGDYRPPGLVREPIFYANIPKRQISKVMDAVKAAVPSGSDNLQHIKRVQPVEGDPSRLSVLLCAQSRVSEDDLRSIVEPVAGDPALVIQHGEQSKYPARTKEESQQWSQQVWPLMWRGNLLAQPPQISTEDREQALKILDQIAVLDQMAVQTAGSVEPACSGQCWIVDSVGSTVGKGSDENSSQPPSQEPRPFSQQHAVMQAIASVAASGSAEYLCLGMDVYCAVEPCVMCCMALIHSRIGRLFFRRSSPKSKGAVEFYCLHGRNQLNHTFESWKYVDAASPPKESELM